MPVPFRDLDPDDDTGIAAYLKLADEPLGRGMRAALFCVNARGEPAAFSFSRIDLPPAVLWRAGELRRRAVASLCKMLFGAVSQTPALLLVMADEVSPRVFSEDVEVRIPVCRVQCDSVTTSAIEEATESIDETLHLFWTGSGRPEAGSSARDLVDLLRARSLLLEPFERAALGLEEAFRSG